MMLINDNCSRRLNTKEINIPIIGILSQETHILKNYIGENHHSFIVASYVKFLESAGARVIPIWIGKDDDYYTHVLNYTNG
ncbi:unnamed protein product, partial [Callosobruchus maculatus]